MKIFRFTQFLLVMILVHSCVSTKFADEGNLAYESGNYEGALQAWDKVMMDYANKGTVEDTAIYYKAGQAALHLDQTDKALTYFKAAQNMQYKSPVLYATLASIYKSMDNLSLEIDALEKYKAALNQVTGADSLIVRLFKTYVESENWDSALELWPTVEDVAKTDVSMLVDYYEVNEALENEDECEQLAGKILELDANNALAMEWFAKNYFWEAENRYVSEMKAYQNNRTNSQYKKLLKAWDVIWPTFRKSRDYFLKLYEIDPKPHYAQYLANIYTRMDKKKEAAYYKARSK